MTAFVGWTAPVALTTDRRGAFVIEGVRPGAHFIRVEAEGFMASTLDVNVEKGAPAEVELLLEKGACEIGGRITEDGKWPLKAEVTLLKAGIVVGKVASSERKGTYRLRNLKEGYYEVRAASLCHTAVEWAGTVGGNEVVDFEMPVVGGCVVWAKCDVCGKTKEVRYCKFCHAFICPDCTNNYPKRVKAMLKRRFSKLGKSERDLMAEYERDLKDPLKRPGCDGCPPHP